MTANNPSKYYPKAGGQFEPVSTGQFQPVKGGQFKPAEGGQFKPDFALTSRKAQIKQELRLMHCIAATIAVEILFVGAAAKRLERKACLPPK